MEEGRKEEEEKVGAQRDTLLIRSGCAPGHRIHSGEKVSGAVQAMKNRYPASAILLARASHRVASGWTRRLCSPEYMRGAELRDERSPFTTKDLEGRQLA